MLKENNIFQWLPLHSDIVNKLKNIISKAPVLANFDERKEITVQTDASKDGVGCCLMQNGKPICYASRSLNDAEKNYAMVEKEYLALVFATKKFHNFIYGRVVNVLTDHKPLIGISNKEVSKIASSRLQRMKIKLLKYNLKVKYCPGKYMFIADALSRAYLPEVDQADDEWISECVHSLSLNLNMSEIRKVEFKEASKRDPTLIQVIDYYYSGWPNSISKVRDAVKPFFNIRNDITVEDDLVFFQNRVVVPSSLKKFILTLLHESHLGITKTQARAKQIVYWPNINNDIKAVIMSCKVCERFRKANTKEPLIPHTIPDLPFNKIASDILEFKNNNYVVVQDYYSKWLEIVPINNKTADEIIRVFKNIFSTHGIPKTLISDNMPYNSYSFRNFASDWNFEIVTSSPNYPRSNGLAERAVQTAKQMLKKCFYDNKDLDICLLEYRNSPIAGLDATPSQLLMSRITRTTIPVTESVLKPKIENNVEPKLLKNQETYKMYHDQHVKKRDSFKPGQNITVNNGDGWESGKVLGPADTPRSYKILNEKGREVRRNSLHIRKSLNQYSPKADGNDCDLDVAQNAYESHKSLDDNLSVTNYTTRSGRTIRRPQKYDDFV